MSKQLHLHKALPIAEYLNQKNVIQLEIHPQKVNYKHQ